MVYEDEEEESQENSNQGFDFDIFDEFDKAVAEYEEDLMKETSNIHSVSEDMEDLADPVETLVENTNSLLRSIDDKYNRVITELQVLQNFSQRVQQSDFEERLQSRLSSLEVKHGNRLKSLKTLMDAGDRQIEQNMMMRFEDFNMLRKTTTSRLSVYEARLDTLEQLVFGLGQAGPGRVEVEEEEEEEEEEDTEISVRDILEDYEDLAGRDFSMLGLTTIGELDSLEYECLVPPCDSDRSYQTFPHCATNPLQVLNNCPQS